MGGIEMSLPAVLLLVWFALELGVNLAKDGEPRTGNHSFLYTFITIGFWVALLWWGGFFK